MSVSKTQVLDQLKRVKGPDLSRNIVDLGMVSEIVIKDGRVIFSITVPASRASELEPLRQAAEKVVKEMAGVTSVTAVLTAETTRVTGPAGGMPTGASNAAGGTARAVAEHPRVREARERGAAGDGGATRAASPQQPSRSPAPSTGPQTGPKPAAQAVTGVKHLIAVASGKGGVGKSTTAVNLALGFQAIGLKAGILDADIYGPSQPRLLGLSGKPQLTGSNKLKPMENFGLKAMSMGFMVDEGTPVVWRGPMVVQALSQMLRDVDWAGSTGGLDVLVIDMPPGTGDVQLTMAQQAPLSGAVIVSTPQDLALIDARKGLAMFQRVSIPVLGIIENMSYFLCPSCGTRTDIFGHGGAETEAKRLGVPFLGAVPLHLDIRTTSDTGKPITATAPDSPHAQIFREIAARTWAEVQQAEGKAIKPPDLTVSNGADTLIVAFEGGARHELSAEMLRVMSPSAEVQGHSPDQRVTVAKKKNVRIKELRPVGNYAVRIVFDDGHDTGLYTWDYLALLGREKDKRWAEYVAELDRKGLSR